MARNTWWVTRPKRSLPPVPRCLMAIALETEGKIWKTADKTTELTIEKNLELAGLKARSDWWRSPHVSSLAEKSRPCFYG